MPTIIFMTTGWFYNVRKPIVCSSHVSIVNRITCYPFFVGFLLKINFINHMHIRLLLIKPTYIYSILYSIFSLLLNKMKLKITREYKGHYYHRYHGCVSLSSAALDESRQVFAFLLCQAITQRPSHCQPNHHLSEPPWNQTAQ